MIRSKKLRDSAKGEECTIQIYPWCEGRSETVVLCHFSSEDHGMGLKSPDYWAAYGCFTCHSIIDGRMKVDLAEREIDACKVRGLFRTWARMIHNGLIIVKGAA